MISYLQRRYGMFFYEEIIKIYIEKDIIDLLYNECLQFADE
jgi:hypothetical protein